MDIHLTLLFEESFQLYSNWKLIKKEHSTIIGAYNNWLKPIKTEINRDLTVDEIKQLKSSFYSLVYNSLIEKSYNEA